MQLWLLELILFIDDLHPANCGQWETDGNAAIVDFFMKSGSENDASRYALNDPIKSFCTKYPKIDWDPLSEKLFYSTSEKERLEMAKDCLKSWNMLSQIDVANKEIEREKERIKAADTRFGHPDRPTHKPTNSLESYIKAIKDNVNKFLVGN